jgi:hypothetical protein
MVPRRILGFRDLQIQEERPGRHTKKLFLKETGIIAIGNDPNRHSKKGALKFLHQFSNMGSLMTFRIKVVVVE